MTLAVEEAAKQDDGDDRSRRTPLLLWLSPRLLCS